MKTLILRCGAARDGVGEAQRGAGDGHGLHADEDHGVAGEGLPGAVPVVPAHLGRHADERGGPTEVVGGRGQLLGRGRLLSSVYRGHYIVSRHFFFTL